MSVGQARAVAKFDGLICQQAQRPAGPPFRWFTTGQGGNAGPLFAINTERAARTRLLVQDLQARLEIAIAQRATLCRLTCSASAIWSRV